MPTAPTSTKHDVHDPRYMSGPQLAHLGIKLLNKHDLLLQCMDCSETWSPILDKKGHLPEGYWICPNGCNR
jgi:hypothetical protein